MIDDTTFRQLYLSVGCRDRERREDSENQGEGIKYLYLIPGKIVMVYF